MKIVKTEKHFEFDPNYTPLIPGIVVTALVPGTATTIVSKHYGVASTPAAVEAAKRDVRYRAEQLAPAPVRNRTERVFIPRVREEFDDFDMHGRQRRERFTRKERAYA